MGFFEGEPRWVSRLAGFVDPTTGLVVLEQIVPAMFACWWYVVSGDVLVGGIRVFSKDDRRANQKGILIMGDQVGAISRDPVPASKVPGIAVLSKGKGFLVPKLVSTR